MKYLISTIYLVLFWYSTLSAQITATPNSLLTNIATSDMAVTPSTDKNSVSTYTYLTETQSPTLKTGEASVDIQYFDGLGRPEETVSVKASPAGKDIVALQTYDSFGRADTTFLPYASATTGGIYVPKSSVISALPAYLTSNFDLLGTDNQYGFSQSEYEPSPLNRILKQGAPGEDWQLAAHPVSYGYLTNTSSITSWKYNSDDSKSSITYLANTLKIDQTKDEDTILSQTYTDFEGKVVMKQLFNGTSWLKTRYCYDDFGLLRCVIPPQASDPDHYPSYCFFYKYDARKHMTDKKVPDSEWGYMIYDARDRLVLSSDGNSRVNNTNKWYYTKYDDLNRATEKGEITFDAAVTRDSLVSYYEKNTQFYSSTTIKPLEELIYDAIPTIYPYNDSKLRFAKALPDMADQATNTKGLLVAKRKSYVQKSGISSLLLVEVYYYDKYGRNILTANKNYQGYIERTSNVYNFAGQAVQTRVHQYYSSTNYYILDTFFKYDHRGRLIQTDYLVDGNSGHLVPRTVVSAMVYDEAGQLKTKYLHSQNSQTFLQKVDYRYNIRGWLTVINDPGLTGTENDQFGMTLYYNKSSSGTAGYYNGNIQGEKWGNTSYLNQLNTYTYDKLNRITGSKFGNTNSFRTSYSYDSNGNISKLTRRGSTGTYIDSISYGYKTYTNQLDYTSDYYGDAPGLDFPGTLTGSNHYQYDANGNMTRDDYKSVTISYNSFNLPLEMDFGNNQKLNYYYDGSGKKLTKINSPGTYYPTNTEYRGLMVHQSCNGTSSLKYIITPEGRLLNTGTNAAPVWGWEYDLKDHLGNVRVVFKPNATNNGVVRNGYANYFPFGMKMLSPYVSGVMSNYLYNGKENQDDFSLNWYDYGARFYDPAIARWNSVDPMADKGRRWSPYNYCMNNPMRFIDTDGMFPGDIFKSKRLAAADFAKLYNDNSIKTKREYGTTINLIKDKNNKQVGYAYTVPTVGSNDGLTVINESTAFPNAEKVADAHTHGAYEKKYGRGNNNFSDTDKKGNEKDNTTGYVITPNGSIKEYDPNTGTETDLTNTEEPYSNIPSDQNDKTKVNSVDARSEELSSNEPSVSTFRTIVNKLFNW